MNRLSRNCAKSPCSVRKTHAPAEEIVFGDTSGHVRDRPFHLPRWNERSVVAVALGHVNGGHRLPVHS